MTYAPTAPIERLREEGGCDSRCRLYGGMIPEPPMGKAKLSLVHSLNGTDRARAIYDESDGANVPAKLREHHRQWDMADFGPPWLDTSLPDPVGDWLTELSDAIAELPSPWAIFRNTHPRRIRWGRTTTPEYGHRLYFLGPIIIARRRRDAE